MYSSIYFSQCVSEKIEMNTCLNILDIIFSDILQNGTYILVTQAVQSISAPNAK